VDEPKYKPCNALHLRGLFIFRKLREHDTAKFQDVMTDLYRDDQPDPEDIGRFEWQAILAYMGASEDEIAEFSPSLRDTASRGAFLYGDPTVDLDDA